MRYFEPIAIVIAFFLCLFLVQKCSKWVKGDEEKEVIYKTDTVVEYVEVTKFEPKDRIITKYDTIIQYRCDTVLKIVYINDKDTLYDKKIIIDTNVCIIPMETILYTNDSCEVQVSGYKPNVDWVKLYYTTVTNNTYKDPKLNLQFSAGAEYDFYSKILLPKLEFSLRLKKLEFYVNTKVGYSIPDTKFNPEFRVGVDVPIWQYRK